METGTLPDEEVVKPKAAPKLLYTVEFSCYNTLYLDYFLLENSKMILPALFEKTNCFTCVVHAAAEYVSCIKEDPLADSDVFLITYGSYNAYLKFLSYSSTPELAWEDTKQKIHDSILKVDMTRYRLVRKERSAFIQPFVLEPLNFYRYQKQIKFRNLALVPVQDHSRKLIYK